MCAVKYRAGGDLWAPLSGGVGACPPPPPLRKSPACLRAGCRQVPARWGCGLGGRLKHTLRKHPPSVRFCASALRRPRCWPSLAAIGQHTKHIMSIHSNKHFFCSARKIPSKRSELDDSDDAMHKGQRCSSFFLKNKQNRNRTEV